MSSNYDDFTHPGAKYMSSTDFNTPQVKVATDSRLGDDGASGIMQSEDSLYADTNMVDVVDIYGLGDNLGDAPYYGISQVDPNLSNILNDDMANIDLQADSNDALPTQAYAGDVSSAALTPPNKPRRTPSKRIKKSKKKQPVAVDDPEAQALSGEEDDNEQPEDDSDEFTPEPAVAKKSAKKTRTPSKRKPTTPKTPKSAATSRKATRKSARTSANKPRDEIPFNRQRRAPKNGITEARPIARCYEECDEADKALIDLREKELKTWKDIRVVWEEMTGQKTGNSTLPNRYERLKDNFSIIKEEDRARLLEAKDKVEKEFNEMKWALIAETIQQEGGDLYTPDNLQRQYKKLMVKEGLRPPPGIVDPDFKVAISEDEAGGDDDDDE